MRKKEQKLIITFHTTAEAIALERAFRKQSVPGRLIPVPRQISSGCGLSWSMPADWSGRVGEVAASLGLQYQAIGEYVI